MPMDASGNEKLRLAVGYYVQYCDRFFHGGVRERKHNYAAPAVEGHPDCDSCACFAKHLGCAVAAGECHVQRIKWHANRLSDVDERLLHGHLAPATLTGGAVTINTCRLTLHPAPTH